MKNVGESSIAYQMKWYDIKPSAYRKEILKNLTAEARTLQDSFDYDFAMRIIDMYLDEY